MNICIRKDIHICICICIYICIYVHICVYILYINAEMPDCLASSQSGTGLKKTNDAGTGPVLDKAYTVQHFLGPVPDYNSGCRNDDAGVS